MIVGKILYYHRKKKKLTQEQVCKDICSITHYSKIENNSKEVSNETLQLLSERLGISISNEKEEIASISNSLKTFYDSIVNYNKEQMANMYEKLSEKHEYIICTPLVYEYYLLIFRYHLSNYQVTEAYELMEWLQQQQTKFSQYERFLMTYFSGILWMIKQENWKALKMFNEIEPFAVEYEHRVYEYYYHKALVHSSLGQATMATYYSEKSISFFSKNNNFIRNLETKIIQAINFTRIADYKKAEELFMNIQTQAEYFNQQDIAARNFHNFGYLYYCQEKYEDAIAQYNKSLSLKQKGTDIYISTLLSIIEIYNILKDSQKALELVEEALEYLPTYSAPNRSRLELSYVELTVSESSFISYLENISMPSFQKLRENEKVKRCAYQVATFYESNGNFEKSSKYFKLALLHDKE